MLAIAATIFPLWLMVSMDNLLNHDHELNGPSLFSDSNGNKTDDNTNGNDSNDEDDE